MSAGFITVDVASGPGDRVQIKDMKPTAFDRFAKNYERIHGESMPPLLESRQFMEQKLGWVLEFLETHFTAEASADVLDFGCGVGRVLAGLSDHPSVRSLTGIDESAESIKIAEAQAKSFSKPSGFGRAVADFSIDRRYELILAFNVFHHVAPDQRATLAALLASRLKLGGYFLLWEHNPWSPAARYLVKSCPFDKGVTLLKRAEAEGLLADGGLKHISSEFVNVTPPLLQKFPPFRWLDSATSAWPLGAQFRMVFQNAD